LETAYSTVSTPAAIPVTVPPATDADVLLLLQVPPVAGSVSTIAAPAQTDDGPEIKPADGDAFTVIVLVAEAVPQVPVIEYSMVSTPAATPLTTPPATDAVALLALQVPPVIRSLNVVEDPVHTLEAPVNMPIPVALTVNILLA